MINHAARMLLVSAVAAFMGGCTDGSRPQQHGESALAKELAGTWEITFHLDRPPLLGADTLSLKRDVSGTFVFLANRSLEGRYPGVSNVTNYGTYDIDFTAFGFDPRDTGRIPTVAVDSVAADSIEVVLSTEEGGISVRMRGGIRRDTVTGQWQVLFPRVGAGGGSFLMTPRPTRKF